jgi:hypothetical protein
VQCIKQEMTGPFAVAAPCGSVLPTRDYGCFNRSFCFTVIAAIRCSTMLRTTIYTTLIVILMLGAASAQTDKQGLPGYTNSVRTDLEKKNDREIDRAYQSTIGRPDAEKKKSDPWADVRPAPPAAAKNKQ